MKTLEFYEAKAEDPSDAGAAYAFCQRLADRHPENFPVASPMLSRRLRRHVAAVYAFARIADDIADEAEHKDARLERLRDWRRQLDAVGRETPKHPVFVALADTFRALDLPRGPFEELLDAALQDCTKTRYETFEELLDYCRRSADPVGRLVLMIHGYRDPELFKLSDCVCSGLRLVDFMQDLSGDLKRDRIYLPQEDFRACGYSEADLRMGVANERFRNLVKLTWKRTKALFEEGRPLSARLDWPLRWEVRLTWFGGMEVLRKVRKQGFDTLHRRPRIGVFDWPPLAFKTLTRR
ncbi:MAG: squalene synthase HpnC [Elusimicrobiota bacterium]